MLFKISKGLAENLPSQIKPGNCWYTQDDNRFYIDTELGRKCINDIPTDLADLLSDSTHRLVTDEQINRWTAAATATDTLGTAATKNVAQSGNATSTQVVMGNDTRLTDSRPASDVYAWAKEANKPTYTSAEVGAIDATLKGAANGVAELDSNGLVPASQLPSYVDDILEFSSYSDFPISGETGKIYVDTTENLTYRWSGTQYIEISASLALGETSSTAFRGDYGKVAYDHASAKGSAFSSDLYKITTNAEGHVTGAVKATKEDITGLGIPGSDTNTTYTLTQNATDGHVLTFTPSSGNPTTITIPDDDTTYENATQSADGLMSAEDKTKLDSIASGAQVNTITGVKGDSESNYRTGNVNITKSNIGLGNVENKSSATIRGELTKANVTTALGYTPPQQDTTYSSLEAESSGTDVSLVTTGEKYIWNNKSDFSGSYNDLSNKPTLGTAAAKNVASSGNASTSQVVMGNDTRLSDARPASDVSSWAKASTKPTYTASEVGLGNVGNFKAVSTVSNQGLSATEKSNARANIGAGTSSFSGSYNDLSNKPTLFSGSYTDLTNKPTLGTAASKDVASSGNASSTQVVMGNDSRLTDSRNAKDVYSWAKAASKPTYTASEVGAIASTLKGAANGVAELDANGKVPSTQLPSYVDDVLEYNGMSSFPTTGENGKIYVDTSTNKTYRWSGSAYTEISASLALGETSATAYRGDRGKIAYDHSQTTSGNPHNVTKSDVGLGNVGNFKAVSTVASQGLSATEQANARTNIGAGTSSFSGSYTDLSNKPTLGTAAAKDVASSGNASTSQVVMGNDTRLSDARPASDVSSWAKASTKPTYTASEVGLGNVGNFKAVSTVANQGLTDTEKSNARTNIGAGTSSLTLGTGSGNAYRGDYGNTAYTHSQLTSGNPHGVTKSDVGLGNVGNFKAVSTVASQGLTATEQSNARANIGAGTSSFSGSYNDLSNKPTLGTAAAKDVASSGNASNTQVVMGNDTRLSDSRNAKDVYSWAKASTKPSYTASEVGAIATTAKGTASGVAELDANGKVPSSQLPSFVDDVLEYNGTSSFPTTGETGKIYVDTSTNKTYRWGVSSYVEISPSLALGETSSTAYRGDRGKTAYDHSQTTSGNPHNVTKTDVGLGNVGNFKAVSTVANQGLSATEQSNARANIGAGTSSFSGSYSDLTNKPTIPTYESKAAVSGGTDVSLVTTGEKAIWNAKTSNVGTITGINMNGASKGTSGVVDLGTVITSHQDISGKADKSATVSTVAWDSTNKKLTKTINGTTNDVVTGATILDGLTKSQVTTALGYTPPTTDTNTHYTSKNVVGATTATSNTTTALTNGNVYLNSVENGAVTSSHKISGSGSTTVTTDASGNIVINSTDTQRSVSDAVNSTSSTVAASSKAVKTAYDLAASKTSNTGTVTKVSTGIGLTGGDITTTGTVKAKLKTETARTIDALSADTSTTKLYPVVADKSGYLAVGVPWTDSDHITSATTSGSGNAVTAISADANGALTVTKGTTFLTSHQDISGKANLASPAFSGTPTAPTAANGTNNTQIATTAFVMNAFTANDAMVFKGTIGSSGATVTALPATHYQGWTYKVITAGTYAGAACEIGDMIICITDGTSANDAHWTVVQSNIDGAVTGPASSVDARVAVFNGTSGKVIKDSGFTIAKSVPSNAVFTDTDTKVTAVGNHYTPSGGTTKSASGGTATNATGSGNAQQVVTGVTVDAAGHVTGVTSKGIYSTDTNTTYSAGTGLSLSGTAFSVKTGYTTSGNNRAVQADSNGNLYVTQKDNNTTYSAGTGLSLSGTTFSVKTGYTTSGNNRAVQADSNGNLYVTQKDDNTDTKNTAGSTDTSSKIFLVGATSQAANPQTYSDNEVFATSGVLTTKSVQIGGGAATMQFNNTTKSIDFIFA